MDAISYTTARDELAQIMDRVCAGREPLMIARQRRPAVVMLSLESFRALEETAYLLRSPKNAIRLLDATDNLQRDQGPDVA